MINSGERGFGLPKFTHAERDRRWSRLRDANDLTPSLVFPTKAIGTNFKPMFVI
jgi:hypothetical protein